MSGEINALSPAIGGSDSPGAKHARTANAMAESHAYLRCDECGRLVRTTVEDLRRSPTAREYIHHDQVMRMLDYGEEKQYRQALRELMDREAEKRAIEYIAKQEESIMSSKRRESAKRANRAYRLRRSSQGAFDASV